MPQRILTIQIKRIGDLVLTIPALRLLKRKRPEAAISLVTMGAAGDLVPAIPAVTTHFNYRPHRPNLALWTAIAGERYEASLDFNGNDRAAFMTFLGRAGKRAAYTKRALGFPRSAIFTHTCDASLKKLHTIDHMIALLETIGIAPEPEPVRLEIPGALRSRFEDRLPPGQPFAAIHPGTARVEKYWEPDRWARVIEFLNREHDLPVMITGGNDPAEARHIAEIRHAAGDARVTDWSGRLSVLETAELIRRSSIALSVDTAATHLASAFELPQVVLYGPTNPYQWRPRHPNARILIAGTDRPIREDEHQPTIPRIPMTELRTETVLETVDSLVRNVS